MGLLRRRIQVKRVRDRDQGERLAYRWRITVARSNRPPEVTEGVLFATRDGGIAPATGPAADQGFGTVIGLLVNERRRSGQFPEQMDIHEGPRPDPASQRPQQPLTHRRGRSGLGLGTLAERAERHRRSQG